MLPYVKINFENGALGRIAPSPDGLFGFIAQAAPVTDGLTIGVIYTLTSFAQAIAVLKITTVNNLALYLDLESFYNEAGEGTELKFMGVANTTTMTAMLTDAGGIYAKKLIAEGGGIRALFVNVMNSGGVDPTKGMANDVSTARPAAQTLANWAAQTLKSPIFVAIAGYGITTAYDISDWADLHIETNNRVCVFVGSIDPETQCTMGLLAGRLARIPVQRNIGRVRDGAIVPGYAYVGTAPAADNGVNIEGIHNLGYITLRKHVGRAGYFFTDDPLATLPTDDYNGIAARRVIDKAYRIAYNTLIDELLNEITVNSSGQVSVSYAKSLESKVENAVVGSMTSNGELGNDPGDQNDTGVQCIVDPEQNVVTTGKLIIGLRVKPHGYAKYIEVNLGFETITQ